MNASPFIRKERFMIRAIALSVLVGFMAIVILAGWSQAGAAEKTAVEKAAAAKEANLDMGRLKDIGLGLQNYHSAHKEFPDVAMRDSAGKPLLSWRVAILPYLEGGPDLYKQFHLDEAWDSEHNQQLIDKMPGVFQSPKTEKGRTRYLAPVGEGLAFTAEKGGLNFKAFTDGANKTILVVEADPEHSVVWTRPKDLVVDLENPKRGIVVGDAALVTLFVDGSAHRFALNGPVGSDFLRALLTRNGGEKVDLDHETVEK